MKGIDQPERRVRRLAGRAMFALLTLATTLQPGAPALGADPDASAKAVRRLDRTSVGLRARPLGDDEKRDIRRAIESGETYASVYKRYSDRFLDRDFYYRFSKGDLGSEFFGNRASTLFLGRMAIHRPSAAPDSWVYYLPQLHPNGATPPCPASARVKVTPWWAKDHPISVCSDSYHPEKTFDEIGYCAGKSELTITEPPRPGCACGPLLIGCLPPADTHPTFVDDMDTGVTDEVAVTVSDIVRSGRPFDEIMTTSRTWQSGIVEFIYARREMLKILRAEPYSARVDARLRAILAPIRVDGPGHWVERSGIYAHAGVNWGTTAWQMALPTYRTQARASLQFLCAGLKGVNVTAEQLSAAVGDGKSELRALEVSESPMRSLVGCSGCHAPMDNTAGFLAELSTPLFGAYPTGREAVGKLYVHGAEDYRGTAKGLAGLSKLLTVQPEYDGCAVGGIARRVGLPLRSSVDDLVADFRASGRNADKIIRRIVAENEAAP